MRVDSRYTHRSLSDMMLNRIELERNAYNQTRQSLMELAVDRTARFARIVEDLKRRPVRDFRHVRLVHDPREYRLRRVG